MIWHQTILQLTPRRRGFHLITREVLSAMPQLRSVRTGMLQIFIQHTSASLCLSENASPEVLTDLETCFNRLAPEQESGILHTVEGADDMPAHLKAALLGSSLLLPVRAGAPALGTWQGVMLCEHRNQGGPRRLVLTLWGEGT
jgi:secondary thiamine-phosphate synthase enzyme